MRHMSDEEYMQFKEFKMQKEIQRRNLQQRGLVTHTSNMRITEEDMMLDDRQDN